LVKFGRLLGALFKSLGGWTVMPAVAAAVGFVVWAPDEIARQYKFEKLRYDYGEWFFFAFWMAVALFASACAVQLLRLLRDKIVDGYTALRRRSAVRRTLIDLTSDEVVLMFALLTSYADVFEAGSGCLVVRKLRLSGLVEFGSAVGLGSRAYRVPAEVWRELPRFKERWQEVVEACGINSPEQLQTRVRAILALPNVEH
jgi:hypothetical protein